MRIAIVIEQFRPAAGGNERSTDEIARRLIARGHELTVLTSRREPGDDPLPGGKVVVGGANPRSATGLIRFARWAEGEIADGRYDVSLSMTPSVAADVLQPRCGTIRETLRRNIALRGGPMNRAAKRIGLAVNPKQMLLLAREWRTLNHPQLKKIAAISRYAGDQLFHHYTIPPRRTQIIPNAAEADVPGEDERRELRLKTRRSLGLGDDEVAFLFVAMNPRLKGAFPLCRTMHRLVRDRPEARLLLAGDMQWPVMREIQRRRLTEIARIVGPTRQMRTLYLAADVTVLPTFYDPSSKVILESLLYGVPAVSTLFNGASQWIYSPTGEHPIPTPFDVEPRGLFHHEHEQPAGRVIGTPTDHASLTQAMAEMCDPGERQRCAEATQQIGDRISMDHHVEKLEVLLREVAADK